MHIKKKTEQPNQQKILTNKWNKTIRKQCLLYPQIQETDRMLFAKVQSNLTPQNNGRMTVCCLRLFIADLQEMGFHPRAFSEIYSIVWGKYKDSHAYYNVFLLHP